MKRLWRASRRPLRWARRLLLLLLLPLTLLAAAGQWWLLPNLNHYRDDLAAALSAALHAPTRIEAATAERDGGQLKLRLRNVSLRDPETGAVLASFSRAAATLDLWRSLWQWRPVFSHIRLEGVNLTLEQELDGIPRLRADTATDSAPTLPEVGRWLFEVGRLDIVGDRLTVLRRAGNPLHLLYPYFQVRDTGRGQRLTFTAEWPDELGNQLEFSVERITTEIESWQGSFELRIERLNLAEWLPPPSGESSRSPPLSAALTISGDWRDWQPFRVETHLRLNRSEGGSDLTLTGQRLPEGWQVQGQAQLTDRHGQIVAEPRFEANQTGGQWQGWIRKLRTQDLLIGAMPWLAEPARQWLTPLQLRGELPEITFQFDPAAATYAVTAQLCEATLQPVRGLPGLNNLCGTVELTPGQGRVTLDSRKVRVDAAGLLRAPVTLETLAGAIAWRREADGWRLSSAGLDLINADLNARFWGNVLIADSGTPLLDLHSHYHEVKASAIRHYLPVTVIPPKGIAWLDRALVSGRVTTGDAILRGPAAAFPYDQGGGLFETRFQVDNTVLDYAPGWPRLEAAKGIVLFRGSSMQVDISAGRLLDAKVERIAAHVADFNKTVVQVKGKAKGPGASLWRALRDSPFGRDLGDDLPDLRIDGANSLDLELTIPVDEEPIRVQGRVGLLDNTVKLADGNLQLDRLRGEVRFSEANLNAKEVQARLRGEPAQIDLDLVGGEGNRNLRAQLRGQWGLPTLAGPAAELLKQHVSGKSAWEAVLTVPTGRRARLEPTAAFTLDAHSDLRGVTVRLPAPLGKTSTETRPLRISLRPGSAENREIALRYGENVQAAMELANFSADPQLLRGELRINAGAARLPDAPGLAITARLPRWELSNLGGSAHNPSSSNGTVAGSWRMIRSLDLRIDEWVVGSQTFADVALNAARQDQTIQIEIRSETLAGKVTVPDESNPNRPIQAALRRLHLRRAADSPESAATVASHANEIDPRRWPPLAVTVADLRLNGVRLGRLRLAALPQSSGIRLTEFTLDSRQQHITASGDWERSRNGPISRLNVKLQSRALSQTLAAFGYSGVGIAQGETQVELAVNWAADLPDFALELLEGSLKLRVGPGQLLDIDPGVGRMLGLFNVQNLMRRLTLDFSDIVKPGMSFDQITGEFTFRQGHAYTDNLLIESPTARIEIQGRTGLKERDYAQRITVTPQFSGALPVAGAIAGGPAVGAAVLLAERLLQKGIEKAGSYRYALSGSWDQPVMKRLEEQQPPAAKGLAGDQ